MQTAIAVGICCGNAEKELEVLSGITEEQLTAMDTFLKEADITVRESDSNCPFDIQVKVSAGTDSAYIRIIGNHTNVVCMRRNDKILLDKPFSDEIIQAADNRKLLNVRDIVAFADTVNIDDVREVLKRQIDYNTAIAETGMNGHYGAGIGKILIRSYGNSVQIARRRMPPQDLDARMNGCELPVVINSGSGNQGRQPLFLLSSMRKSAMCLKICFIAHW